MKYNKPALSNADLLARWQAKGLAVASAAEAERALNFNGYFRLRGYTEPLLPPSWLMAECLSFGKWSVLYQHLQKADPAHPNPKKTVAKAFGLSVSLLESWLHALTILRNTCAHHGRIWNRRFGYRPEVYAHARPHFSDPQSYYCLAVVMRLFSRAVDAHDEWPVRLMDLFKAHPAIAPAELGFPAGWEVAPIWN